ncbi:uncharacterized protein LOC111112519 [Crassostrea virginica]
MSSVRWKYTVRRMQDLLPRCPSPGYYGENCSLECPQNCQDGYCDIVEGTCFGCSHRYIGPRCTKDCPSGLYGSNCSQNCSMTCGDPGYCDIMTGHCNGGCQVGWTGVMCEKDCQEGLYGRNCLQNCSMTCGDPGRCDIMTGHCNGGCQVGWTGAMCETENLALHQPAWQSSTWRFYTGAERAVDGQYTDLAWYGRQCAVSDDYRTTAEWRVDLGGVRSIHHIVIQHATDNRVWGCSSPGYYGENCSLECPQNCQNGYCDIVEGTCFGCSHQYIGPTCEDCPSGLYGSNCSQNCSMTCGDPGECDMRTGHCNGGCQVGWTGAMCEKGYHLTINNTHEIFYIMKPLYISTVNDNSLYNNFMAYT